jgi:hypothetical protein
VRAPAVEHLAQEVAQHLLGHVEIGDHSVAERARGRDRRRRAADHPLGLGADCVHEAALGVSSDHGRLGDHDPAARDVHERVGGPEVDRHVVHAQAGGEMAADRMAFEAVSTVEDAPQLAKKAAAVGPVRVNAI